MPRSVSSPRPDRASGPRLSRRDGGSAGCAWLPSNASPSEAAPERAVLASSTARAALAGETSAREQPAAASTGAEAQPLRRSGAGSPDQDPAALPVLQGQVESLNGRLDRIEAACVMAVTTLDSVVSSFEQAQANATEAAREEVRAAFTGEMRPALEEIRTASATAQGEIHGVLRLLGTCLERVVGHLHRLEAAGAASGRVPLPASGSEEQALDAVQEPVAPESEAGPRRVPAAATPAVPLVGFGRRSRLSALIDFGFGTRAA